MDTIYRRMNDDIEMMEVERPPSEILEFYKGKTIFLTGCTGFVGKCLVEKLLRTCWNIKKLYVLIRPKKNKDIDERIKDYFNDVIFDKLKRQNPNYLSKLEVIVGDLLLPGVNFSTKDRQVLIENVDIIIHNASVVNFKSKISTIMTINVLGTKELLDLAYECHHLKTFMYISTVYSHCYMPEIDEKFYQHSGDLQMVRDMIKADLENKNGLNNDALKEMLHPFRNAYIYSKAIAENLVEDYAKKLTCSSVVYRMNIVISTYKEPIAGWCGNINGPVFALIAGSKGLLHVWYTNRGTISDVAPVDMIVNSCLVTLWDVMENQKVSGEAAIYNYGSSTVNPLTAEDFIEKTKKFGVEAPTIHMLWIHFMIWCYNYQFFLLLHVLLHYIPSLLMDIILCLQMKKPKFMSFLSKVNVQLDHLIYFTSTTWKIKVKRMEKIWDRMNLTDSELFFCDLRKLNWTEYFITYWTGVRVYLLKDPMDTVEKAKRKYNALLVLHYIVMIAISSLVGYLLFKMLPFFSIELW